MDYICYIDSATSDVPFMDVITSEDLDEVRAYARRLLAERPAATGARLFQGSEFIEDLSTEVAGR